MRTVKLDINYTEYSSIDEMEPQDIELVNAAIERGGVLTHRIPHSMSEPRFVWKTAQS